MNIVQENMVLKLNKALYGLNKATREWFKHIHRFSLENGFKEVDDDKYIHDVDVQRS